MKSLLLLVTTILANFCVYSSSALASDLCSQAKELLQPGDVLFLRIENSLYSRVAQATGGWTNHVGIAFQQTGSKFLRESQKMKRSDSWVVAESTFPKSKLTPLCSFLKKSHNNALAIRRFVFLNQHPLSFEQVQSLFEEAIKRLGMPYDAYFDLDNPKKQYCSKFAYEIFLSALGYEIGKIEVFREYMTNIKSSEDAKKALRFWNLWFFKKIPYEQRVVSPHSEYLNKNLITIFDNSETTLGYRHD